MGDLLSQIRWAARGLARAPTGSVVALMALALGVGAGFMLGWGSDGHDR